LSFNLFLSQTTLPVNNDLSLADKMSKDVIEYICSALDYSNRWWYFIINEGDNFLQAHDFVKQCGGPVHRVPSKRWKQDVRFGL
jgi:hypothetical protein